MSTKSIGKWNCFFEKAIRAGQGTAPVLYANDTTRGLPFVFEKGMQRLEQVRNCREMLSGNLWNLW